jgi:hypothetical protein
MSLNKIIEIDQIEVVRTGHVQVREATIITENGQQISRTFHRYLLFPGQDVSDQPSNVKDICKAAWTKEVIKEYQDEIAKAKSAITIKEQD